MKAKKVKVKEKRKYWYFITVEECVLCGGGGMTKERRYDPKPKHWNDRYSFVQKACGEHFC